MDKPYTTHSRRTFLKTGAAALVGSSAWLTSRPLFAAARMLNLPLGLQLYSVRELLPKDYAGTLRQIAALGYREVEAAGFYDRSAADVKRDMRKFGLRCVSAHYSFDKLHDPRQLEQNIAYIRELGAQYMVCASPGRKNPLPNASGEQPYTLDDWKWTAEQLNTIGEKVHAAGLILGYHNHDAEFHKTEGVVPYIELLRQTDPSKVTMEMDCGWVVVGGGNPVELLRTYPTRITMLHVKDFKDMDKPYSEEDGPPPTELGRGDIDYAPIFAQAAKGGHVRHAFVEQEGFDMPPMEALRIDAEYMKKFNA